MEVDIIGDEEIGRSIAVIVAEGSTRRPTCIATQAGLFAHIGKGAIAIIPVENHATEAGHQKVRPSIVVIVADHGSHTPTWIADTRLIRNIGEGSVVVVVVERSLGLLAVHGHLHTL